MDTYVHTIIFRSSSWELRKKEFNTLRERGYREDDLLVVKPYERAFFKGMAKRMLTGRPVDSLLSRTRFIESYPRWSRLRRLVLLAKNSVVSVIGGGSCRLYSLQLA
jgi:hypothetical protein